LDGQHDIAEGITIGNNGALREDFQTEASEFFWERFEPIGRNP